MGDQRRHGGGRESIATLQSREISFAGCGIVNQAVSPGKRGNIEAFRAGGEQRPRPASDVAPRRMTMLTPDHIHMNLIADDLHAVLFAQQGHGFKLFAAPHFPGRVMRAAQQQQRVARLRQRAFKLRHIAMPLIIPMRQRDRRNATAVSGNGFIKSVIGRRMDYHTIAFVRPLANHLRHHVNDRRAIHDCIAVNGALKTAGVPVGDRAQKLIVFPAAVTEHAVRQAPTDGIKNAGGGGEIHIGDSKGEQVGGTEAVGYVVPLRTPGAVAIDRRCKIKH